MTAHTPLIHYANKIFAKANQYFDMTAIGFMGIGKIEEVVFVSPFHTLLDFINESTQQYYIYAFHSQV